MKASEGKELEEGLWRDGDVQGDRGGLGRRLTPTDCLLQVVRMTMRWRSSWSLRHLVPLDLHVQLLLQIQDCLLLR